MIITFDAGILVRATGRSSGPARKALNTVIAMPEHVIALSPYILGEVGKVLSYPRLQALYRLTADEIHAHVELLRSVSCIVEPVRGLPVVLLDPGDDPVIYTAIAAGADILCTRDRDFYDASVLAFCRKQDIRVMDDVALLERIG